MIENNIDISPTYITKSLNYNALNNNLNFWAFNSFDASGNQGSGNFAATTNFNTLFVNYTSPLDITKIYTYDFHLAANSPYKNGGRDGKDIGIYGGMFPWKAGSVPFNPHVQVKQISPTTDVTGKLQVKIQVQAQDN